MGVERRGHSILHLYDGYLSEFMNTEVFLRKLRGGFAIPTAGGWGSSIEVGSEVGSWRFTVG